MMLVDIYKVILMAKLPYGGHDSQPDPLDTWGFLEEIAESLKKGGPVRPQLARWLGEAISRSKRDKNKLLIALALNTPRGGVAMNPDNWLIYGKKAYDFESLYDLSKEEAINRVLEESARKDGRDAPFSRSTLKNWRNKYAAGVASHRAISNTVSNASE